MCARPMPDPYAPCATTYNYTNTFTLNTQIQMQILKANRTTAGLCASLVQIFKLLNCLNQCYKQEKEEEVEQGTLVD